MSKINDLLINIKSGARSNKYRVLIPIDDGDLSRNLDILCNASSIPGRAITEVDVTIKGKKTKICGETSLEGSWSATFYNTENMQLRIFFDEWIREIHNLDMPEVANNGLLGLERLNEAVGKANSLADSFQRNKDKLSNIVKNPMSLLLGDGPASPSYQKEITIQQLGSDEDSKFEITLLGAFPISIGAIDLTDNGEGISETQVTFSYSDIIINPQSPSMTQTLLGDNVAGLF